MILEIILGIIIFAEGYIIWNLIRKAELLETWVEDFTQRIGRVQNDLKEIDSTGHFEADDEIGTIFDQIKSVVNELQDISGEDINE